MKTLTFKEPGVYFGMPENEYHADPSLSASGIKNLDVSLLTYWVDSVLNPEREDRTTKPMTAGKALHKLIIEGQDAFDEAYATIPEKPYGAIDGGDDLKAKCGELGLKKTGKIIDLCLRIREAEPDAVLWPFILRDFKEANESKIILSAEDAYNIAFPSAIIEKHPVALKAFTGGYPEVSIFWRDPETNMPMKARLDYLKTLAVVELKSFSNPFGKPLDKAIGHAVANHRYYVDAAVRLEAAEQAKKMDVKQWHGELPPPEWIEAFKACPTHALVFVFLEQGKCPNIRVREWRKSETKRGSDSPYFVKGEMAFREGVERYAQCMEHFGPDIPWMNIEPMTPFVDIDFPMWMTD